MTGNTLRVLALVNSEQSLSGTDPDSTPLETVGDATYGGSAGDRTVPQEGTGGDEEQVLMQGDYGPVEQTVQMILDLPEGQDWAWLPDCNIVALSSRLSEDGRQRAISDLQYEWRRSLIKAVPDPPGCPDVA